MEETLGGPSQRGIAHMGEHARTTEHALGARTICKMDKSIRERQGKKI